MQIKKFTASTIKDAMEQVRNELGSDAVILSTKKVPKEGTLGRLLGKENYEIIAAVDPEGGGGTNYDLLQDRSKSSKKSFYFESSKMYPENIIPPVEKGNIPNSEYTNQPVPKVPLPNTEKLMSRIQNRDYLKPEQIKKIDSLPKLDNNLKNIDDLKNRMDSFFLEFDKKVSEKFLESTNSFDILFPQIERILTDLSEMRELINKQTGESDKRNLTSNSICKVLLEHEVEEEIVESIFRNMDYAMRKENPVTSDYFFNYMEKLVSRITKYSGGLELEEGKPRIMALVGPTGVGKTTTIAKLAADVSLVVKKNVVVLSIDTFRIGAQEQLSTYCDILGIPLEIIRNSQELNDRLMAHHDKDLILIDTIGRGSYDISQIKNMSDFFKSSKFPIDINLVLSAVTKWSDLKETLSNFRAFDVSSLLFTKLDETKRYGNLFNLAVRTQLPVSYITNGQNVPEDIEIMSSGLMAGLLLYRHKPSEKLSAKESEKLITL